MITGNENDFTESRAKYFESAYSRSEFIRTLYNEGYNINIYTADYYGYTNASYLANYASNARPKDEGGKAFNTDMRDVYFYLKDNGIRVGESKKSYSFIHLSGTHLPLKYDENFELLPSGDPKRNNATVGMKQSFAIINYYIDEMKRLGVYDNSTIIITGDHPSIGSDSEVPLRYAHVTPIFVKPASLSSGNLETSSAPVTHADLFPTILESEGISSASDFGRSVFDIPADEIRERFYYFQRLDKSDGKVNYDMVIFSVTGKAADYGNWEIIEWYSLGKSIYK